MKVISKPMADGRLEYECTATGLEVNEALENAARNFAISMGIRPQSQTETAAQAIERAMGIKDLDTVIEKDALENLTVYALDKRGLIPAFPPSPITTMALRRGKDYSFRLYVTPKPEYELSSYDAPEMTVPKFVPQLGDAVQRQMDLIAEQYCTYEDIEGEGTVGADSAFSLSTIMKVNGEIDPRLTIEGRSYIMGRDLMPESFETPLLGMKVGETKTFTCMLPDWDEATQTATEVPAECTATIVCMQKKVVPAITDEWVKQTLPMVFSVEMLKETIEMQFSGQQRTEYDAQLKDMVVGSMAGRFSGKIQDAVYENVSKNIINGLRQRVAQQGMTWEQFVQENGGEQQMQMMLMMQTRNTLVSSYVLDAIFRHYGLTVEEKDIKTAVSQFNPEQADNIRKEFEATHRNFVLREMAERCRAERWIMENAKLTYVDPQEYLNQSMN